MCTVLIAAIDELNWFRRLESMTTGSVIVFASCVEPAKLTRGWLLLVDGPSMWEEGPASHELYGFTSAHGDPLRFGNRAPVDMLGN